MPIITYPLNNIEYDASDAETYLSTRTSGVFSAENHFALTLASAREVSISPGLAWINNARFKGKSVASTTSVNLYVDVADSTLSRRDLVVLRFDALSNVSTLAIKKGQPASNAVAPNVERSESAYELGLYIIEIPAGSTSISMSHISNVMLDESYCGLMRDGVTQIPTAQLYAQFRQTIEELEKLYDESYIADLTNRKVSKSGDTMTGPLILSGDPTANLHAVPKQYVDNKVADVQTTASNAQTIASAAQSDASSAQSAAVSAQATANVAQSTANAAMPKSGGTFTGVTTAQNNTSYTTKQVRNVFLVADGASMPSGANGDIVLVYTP